MFKYIIAMFLCLGLLSACGMKGKLDLLQDSEEFESIK